MMYSWPSKVISGRSSEIFSTVSGSVSASGTAVGVVSAAGAVSSGVFSALLSEQETKEDDSISAARMRHSVFFMVFSLFIFSE